MYFSGPLIYRYIHGTLTSRCSESAYRVDKGTIGYYGRANQNGSLASQYHFFIRTTAIQPHFWAWFSALQAIGRRRLVPSCTGIGVPDLYVCRSCNRAWHRHALSLYGTRQSHRARFALPNTHYTGGTGRCAPAKRALRNSAGGGRRVSESGTGDVRRQVQAILLKQTGFWRRCLPYNP